MAEEDKKKKKKLVDRGMYKRKMDQALIDAAGFPSLFAFGDGAFRIRTDVRYGQNPGQAAARYIDLEADDASLMGASVPYAGEKGLSFINITDSNSALKLCDVLSDERTAVVVPVKHSTPSGVGLDFDNNLERAYERAFRGDPKSIFGCSMAVNRTVGEDFVRGLKDLLMEVLIAPKFTEDAVEYIRANKPSARLVEIGEGKVSFPEYNLVPVSGGFLIEQVYQTRITSPENLEAITEAKPTDEQLRAGLVAWKIAGQVKSNAVVIVSPDGTHTYGIGAGQMSRVESARIAVYNGTHLYDNGSLENLDGAVAASDAFFPFPDAPELLVKAGVKTIVYPLGSQNDKKTRLLLNEYGAVGLCTRPEPGENKIERAFSGHP
jgi:phosphoribosylaminoimidazolecarboxamide formyltransferase/IMP cyclohydrolase